MTQDCVQAVEGLHCDYRSLAPGRPGVLRLAFLVRRGRSQACQEAPGKLAGRQRCVRSVLLGPWPPLSFLRTSSG